MIIAERKSAMAANTMMGLSAAIADGLLVVGMGTGNCGIWASRSSLIIRLGC